MNEKEKKDFILRSLRISFIVMLILSGITGQIGPNLILVVLFIISLFFTFIISIVHLRKYKKKTFPIITLIISSIFIIIFIFGFITPFLNSTEQQPNTGQQFNVIQRDCVYATNGIMSCDGQGITNTQECEEVCIKENGLNNTAYITKINVDSENLGYVTFNGCYCYDENNNIKYMYIIPT